MLRKIYLGVGGALIMGYLAWSALGWELGGGGRERVPTAQSASGGSMGARSRSSYFGGGFSFGK